MLNSSQDKAIIAVVKGLSMQSDACNPKTHNITNTETGTKAGHVATLHNLLQTLNRKTKSGYVATFDQALNYIPTDGFTHNLDENNNINCKVKRVNINIMVLHLIKFW